MADSKIFELARRFKILENDPGFMILGPAKVGKSTFINILLGKNLSYVGDLICTKRPIRFITKKTSEIKYVCNGEIKQTLDEIGFIIKKLNQESNYSSEEIIIELHGDFNDCMLIDTPGFEVGDYKKEQLISDIIKYQVQLKPQVLILSEASSSIKGNIAIKFLIDLCNKEGIMDEDIIICLNKIDVWYNSVLHRQEVIDDFFEHDFKQDIQFISCLNCFNSQLINISLEEKYLLNNFYPKIRTQSLKNSLV
jgi:GTPase Era involved in 16S rRNA processing